ncbi:MAG: hypothetical protein JW709_00385 [Sedimentisphaerales bacterium]|nr:hypothetical protein [Sedimentisphaerales bacterium]
MMNKNDNNLRWSWRAAILSLLVAVGYAGCDNTRPYVDRGWMTCDCDPNMVGYICIPIDDLAEAFEGGGDWTR